MENHPRRGWRRLEYAGNKWNLLNGCTVLNRYANSANFFKCFTDVIDPSGM